MDDNGLRAYYLGIFSEFKKTESRARELVKAAMPFERRIKKLIKEIKKIRKELHKIFSHPVLYQICNNCYRQFNSCCCQLKTDCPFMFWRDIVYLVANNPKFELPYPDVKFLLSLERYGCLFLTPYGCLLKEGRPIECLAGTCFPDLELGIKRLIASGTLKEGQIINLLGDLNQKTKLLFVYIRNKNGIRSSDNSVADFGLLHATNPLI